MTMNNTMMKAMFAGLTLLSTSCSANAYSDDFVLPAVIWPRQGFAFDEAPNTLEIELETTAAQNIAFSNAQLLRDNKLVVAPKIQKGYNKVVWNVPQKLESGSHSFKFRVPSSFDERRLELNFVRFEPRVWGVKFFVGNKFCVIKTTLCQFPNESTMTLQLVTSGDVRRVDASELKEAVTLEYDSSRAECEPSVDAVPSNELRFNCALPSVAEGAATVTMSSPPIVGAAGGKLEECGSAQPAEPIRLQYMREYCTKMTW